MPSGITPLPCVARIATHRLVLRRQAVFALPALRRVQRNDVIALLQAGDALAHLHHHAGAFVAENRREQTLGIGAGEGVFVGVADAGRLDLDQHLAFARAVELDGFQAQLVAGLAGHGCARLHHSVSWC